MAKKHIDSVETPAPVETVSDDVSYGPDEVLTHIIRDDEGNFHVKDLATGEVGEACKFSDEGDKTIVLTKNRANRKWANRAKVTEAIDRDGFYPLTFKATKHVGSTGSKSTVPNKKMMEWARDNMEGGQALYEEYMAIIDRAAKAKEDAKAKPMTELEKAQAKAEKARKAYEALLAKAAENN